ncbi:MAG: DUF4957 domain-containing protein [Bacteroidales bacterium]|nr:DUF4957 domain-containing protein [Bacteroidales bacterium]
MKNIFSKSISALALAGLAILSAGCVEEIPAVNDELALGRCLTPTEGSVSVNPNDGQTVTFTWTTSKGPSNYLIEIFEGEETANPDDVFAGDPTETLAPETSPASIVLPSDAYWFARVKARKEGLGDSKWLAFPSPIGTYEVKPSVNPEIVSRTSETITVAWTQVDGFVVDHVRVSPNPDPDATSAYKRYEDMPDVEEGAVGSYTVAGLEPSTKYTVAVHYKSANRGEVYAWTRPSLDGATVVDNSEKLLAALKDGAPVISVEYSDTPYVLYELDATEAKVDAVISPSATGQLRIVGNGTEDGKMPVVSGVLNIPNGVKELHLEGIAFDGENYSFSHPVVLAKGISDAISSITMLNCNVTSYKAGFFYYDSGTATLGDLLFKNIMVSDIQGSGGNAFDIRSDVEISRIDVLESTFTNGMRTFFRIDKAKVASMAFNRNTVNNLCFVDDGNNKGLFYIGAGKGQVSIPVFEMTRNLFLNLDGHATRTVFFSDETGVPNKISSNYYYKLGPGFWAKDDVNASGAGKLSQSAGLSDGGAILAGDPCENSAEGNLYVKKTSEVFGKGIGDPRWFENYTPVPESLELTPVEYGKVWNLTDTKMFGKAVDKNIVRDGLRFFVSNTPFNVTETGLEFTGEGVTESTGVPSDGAVAFKVNGPGSVIISVAKSKKGTSNDHLTVALGDADGRNASVKGSAPVDVNKVKVAFPMIAAGEEQIVYLYGCGPVILTAMQWSEDTDTGAPAILDTPVLSIDQPSVDDTYTGDVTVSWQEVSSAGSYKVTVNGEESSVNVPAYVFRPATMKPGKYEVTVQALPAEGDLAKEPSEISEKLVFEIKETLKPVSAAVPTSWGNDYFASAIVNYGTGDLTEGFVTGNLSYITGGGKFKFGENEVEINGTNGKYSRVQIGGTGAAGTKASMQFIAGGPGKLTLTAIAGGDETEKNRVLAVAIGDQNAGTIALPLLRSEGVVTGTIDCSSASAGSLINIYSQNKGINVFEIVWTPAGYDPDAGIPFDETAINEAYMMDLSEYTPEDITEDTQKGKLTWLASSSAKVTFEASRVKFNGGATIGDDGIPVARACRFKITKPGVITHKIISSSSSDATRMATVILVKETSAGQEVVTLYNEFAATSSSADAVLTEVTSAHLDGAVKSVDVYVFSGKNPDTGKSTAVNVHALGFAPAN